MQFYNIATLKKKAFDKTFQNDKKFSHTCGMAIQAKWLPLSIFLSSASICKSRWCSLLGSQMEIFVWGGNVTPWKALALVVHDCRLSFWLPVYLRVSCVGIRTWQCAFMNTSLDIRNTKTTQTWSVIPERLICYVQNQSVQFSYNYVSKHI